MFKNDHLDRKLNFILQCFNKNYVRLKIDIPLNPNPLRVGTEFVSVIVCVFGQQGIMLTEFPQRLKIPFIAEMDGASIVTEIMINAGQDKVPTIEVERGLCRIRHEYRQLG